MHQEAYRILPCYEYNNSINSRCQFWKIPVGDIPMEQLEKMFACAPPFRQKSTVNIISLKRRCL
ncbi:hypothetical protein B1R38_05190 [Bacillus cereus]|nr:hypothetical protein B1R38_05190 [Bacillus cereus]